MTHSDEVTNGSQKPGPTDASAGLITPTQTESVESVRLAQQARRTLGALYKNSAQSHVTQNEINRRVL